MRFLGAEEDLRTHNASKISSVTLRTFIFGSSQALTTKFTACVWVWIRWSLYLSSLKNISYRNNLGQVSSRLVE